jgi:hypothetical protein
MATSAFSHGAADGMMFVRIWPWRSKGSELYVEVAHFKILIFQMKYDETK